MPLLLNNLKENCQHLFYIEPAGANTIRAWQGYRTERKLFWQPLVFSNCNQFP
jgi:hypothetical protein